MGRAGTARPARIGSSWSVVVLVLLFFNLVLPALDATALERDPWHDHLVFGAVGQDAEVVLRAHRHRYELQSHRPCATCAVEDESAHGAPATDEGFVVVRSDTVAGSPFGLLGKMLLATSGEVSLPRVLPQWSPVGDLPAFEGVALPLPDPPPRVFSSTLV